MLLGSPAEHTVNMENNAEGSQKQRPKFSHNPAITYFCVDSDKQLDQHFQETPELPHWLQQDSRQQALWNVL